MPNSVRRNVAWSMTAVIGRNVFYVATYMLLARLLDPHAFGLIAIAMVAMGIGLTFVDSGFASVIVRMQVLDRDKLSSLYWFIAALGTAAAAIVAAAGPFVSMVYHDSRLTRLFVTAGAALFIGAFGQQFLSLLQRQMAFKQIALIEICSAAAAFAVSAGRVLAGAGAQAYFEGLAVGSAITATAAFFPARKLFVPRPRFRFTDLRGFFSFGCYNTGERLINYASFNIEKLLMGRLFDLTTLGLYTVVNQIITRPVVFFSNAFSRVAYPIFSDLRNDYNNLNRRYIGYIGRLCLITFPIYGFVYLFSDPVITVLFGHRFLDAGNFVPPLCILGAIWSIGNPFGSYLMALNRARTGFFFNMVSVFLTAAVFIFGGRFGMPAMLWIWLAAVSAVLLPLELTVRRYLTGMSIARYVRAVAPHAAVITLLCAAGRICLSAFHESALLTVAAMAAYAALCGFYGLRVIRAKPGG